MRTIDLDCFLKIFEIRKKKELLTYCNNLTIYQSDLVTFIQACKAGATGYNHRSHFKDRVPEHLRLTEEDNIALTANRVGPLKGRAKKTANKIFQTFEERKYTIAHLFYTNSLTYWYLFYFGNRELSDFKNHWTHGKHIHMINDLWFTNMKADEVWEQYISGKLKVSSKVHIRFVD